MLLTNDKPQPSQAHRGRLGHVTLNRVAGYPALLSVATLNRVTGYPALLSVAVYPICRGRLGICRGRLGHVTLNRVTGYPALLSVAVYPICFAPRNLVQVFAFNLLKLHES